MYFNTNLAMYFLIIGLTAIDGCFILCVIILKYCYADDDKDYLEETELVDSKSITATHDESEIIWKGEHQQLRSTVQPPDSAT